ncbi:MAG: hypothetical protein U0871_28040 [Gemmataceae bacterium]
MGVSVCPVHKQPLVPGLGPPPGEPGMKYHADFLVGRKQHFPFDRSSGPGQPAGADPVQFCPACRAARRYWRDLWGLWWEVYGKPRADKPGGRCLVHNRKLLPVPSGEAAGKPLGLEEMTHFGAYSAVERTRFPHTGRQAGGPVQATAHCPDCRAARERWAAAPGTWADKERLMLRGGEPALPTPPPPPTRPWWAFWRKGVSRRA